MKERFDRVKPKDWDIDGMPTEYIDVNGITKKQLKKRSIIMSWVLIILGKALKFTRPYIIKFAFKMSEYARRLILIDRYATPEMFNYIDIMDNDDITIHTQPLLDFSKTTPNKIDDYIALWILGGVKDLREKEKKIDARKGK